MIANSLNSLVPFLAISALDVKTLRLLLLLMSAGNFIVSFVSLGIITLDARVSIRIDTIVIVALLACLTGINAAVALPASCAIFAPIDTLCIGEYEDTIMSSNTIFVHGDFEDIMAFLTISCLGEIFGSLLG